MKQEILVKKIIEKIGETIFTLDSETGENFINDENPLYFPEDYYTKLFREFKTALKLQLEENTNAHFIKIYLVAVKEGMKKLSENLNHNLKTYTEFKDSVYFPEEYFDKYSALVSIISSQSSVLLQVKSILTDELEFVDFENKIDLNSNDFSLLNDNSLDLLNNDIKKESVGRATFNMSKKESLMLIYILEQENLIKFENDIQRRKFIENNFNYTEMRENASNFGETREMIGIGKEFTNFSAFTEAETNNKTLEKLLKKLNETIHLFEFKS